MALKSLLIRIRQWLKENPQVWRHRNLLKIVLYSVISVCICVALWFAQGLTSQEGSTNRRFRAYIKVSTLITGSIISGILNKVLNKKPDAYDLTSCAAFAVMSFCLSRQTNYGFEAEMESFFMGTLLGQLWLIKWWFLSAGGGFWCLLTTLRSFLDAPSEDENVERSDRRFLPIQVDSEQSNTRVALPSVPQQPNSSADGILQEFEYTLKKFDERLLKVSSALSRYLTENNVDYIPLALVNDANILVDELPHEAINECHEKVTLMIDRSSEKQCSNVYSSCRRESLKWICNSLWRRMSLEETWQSFLEKDINIDMIMSWIKLSKICMRVLFPFERRLCDRVFSGFSSVSDISFMQVCSEMTSNILNFAKVFAENSYSHPLTETLQAFDTLLGLIPEFQSLFSDEYSAPLRNEATTIRKALEGAIRDCYLKEFEDMMNHMIRHDIEQESVLGGIHPITVKVMDLLDKVAMRNRMSFLSVHMAKIIELLEIHLENRFKSYPNNALGYVFLMNNQRYVVKKVQVSKLRAAFGDDWIQQQRAKVQQYLEHYQRSSWDEVLGILKLDNNEELNMTEESMIKKLHLFNMHFKQIWKVQCTWFVIEELREEMRKSLENILLLAYGLFIGRLYEVLGKCADMYIRYSIDELGALLKDLFNGREN